MVPIILCVRLCNVLRTVLDVANAIISKQKNFFLKGVMYFEPMTLGDIASICSLNESTISRTVNGKYMQTPTGLYEMKFFFHRILILKILIALFLAQKEKSLLGPL
jgi:DNA-directed RNA polymerase specialized sigma54-like protein